MLSSKKKLISCLLQRIASDADACRTVVAAAAAPNTAGTSRRHHQGHQHQQQQQQLQRHPNSGAGAPLCDEVHRHSHLHPHQRPSPESLLQKVWAVAKCCASAPSEDLADASAARKQSTHHQPLLPDAEASCSSCCCCQQKEAEAGDFQKETKRLLKTLSLRELRHLWEAVQSGGRREGECVLVEQLPRTTRTITTSTSASWLVQRQQQQQQQHQRRPRHRSAFCDGQQQQQTTKASGSGEHEPIMVSCSIEDEEEEEEVEEELDPRLRLSLRWRWPSLDLADQRLFTASSVRPLPTCHQHILGRHSHQHNYHSLCINPYHWALLIPTATVDNCLPEDAYSTSTSNKQKKKKNIISGNGPAAVAKDGCCAAQVVSPTAVMSPADCQPQPPQQLFSGYGSGGGAPHHHQHPHLHPQPLPPASAAHQPPPHHQYYYTPSCPPLTPPPSYHSEADTAELVFAAAAVASASPRLNEEKGGGKASAGNQPRRLSPIRESNNVARNYHHHQQQQHQHSHPHNSKWCRVAYWEFRDRVGDQECRGNAVNVLTASPAAALDGTADALETVELSRCLEQQPPSSESRQQQQINLQSFFRTRRHPNTELARTRAKIGLGVSLYRDEADDSVWLYNRSACPVFVSSRTFNSGSSSNQQTPPQPHPAANGGGVLPVPLKVPPGHMVKAYDFAVASRLQQQRKAGHKTTHNNHPNNHHHQQKNHRHHEFSFSFVKGFGANYSRPDTLQCPCWVEVFLEPPCATLAATDSSRQQQLSDDCCP